MRGRTGVTVAVVGMVGGSIAVDQVPVATAGVAAAAVAAAVWHGWDRTTIGDQERWAAIRKAGGRVGWGARLIAHFPGTPPHLSADDAEEFESPAEPSVPEAWVRRIGRAMAAAGRPVDRQFAVLIAEALAAAGPVPDSPAGLSAWVDEVTDTLLTEGYRTRSAEADLLVEVARQVGRPRGLTVAS